MRYLRTNTATRITVGPFFDKTDGVTPEVAITVTSCKLTFMVDTGGVPTLVIDAAPTASAGDNDMVHVTGDDAGFYDLELTAAQVNYLGRAMMAITDAATHCPVFHEFMILPANVYDSLILGTDLLDANASQLGGTSQTGRDLGTSVLLSSGTGTGQVKLSGGYVAPNWGDVGNPTTAVGLTGTTIATTQKVDVETVKTQAVTCAAPVTVLASVGTAATSTAQTGDSYALANGANGFVAIKGDTTAILIDTAEIGVAGAGLSNIGTIATVTNLTNLPAAAALEATLTAMKGATFDGATDSLEALRNRGDAAWITAAGFSTHSAADVWTSITRTLTAVPTGTALEATLTTMQGATFDGATDSLEAIRNRGDASWITATGFSTHAAADVWSVATRQLTAAQTFDITGSLSGSVGSVTGAVGSVTGSVTVGTNNDKTGYALSAAGVTAVWAEALETLTAAQIMRILLAALGGKRDGLGTATEQYFAQNGTTPRITLTPDADGNGTPVLDGAA